jgi:hypothetical protein
MHSRLIDLAKTLLQAGGNSNPVAATRIKRMQSAFRSNVFSTNNEISAFYERRRFFTVYLFHRIPQLAPNPKPDQSSHAFKPPFKDFP